MSEGANAPRVCGIVLAAGSRQRFGGRKQYERLAGRTLLQWPIDGMGTVTGWSVSVVPPGFEGTIEGRAVEGAGTRAAPSVAG